MNRYRLTLRSLKFLSAVDFPAQAPAVCVLTKSASKAPEVKATYRVSKMDEALGLVIGMSIITSIDGVPYTDLQGDEVQEQDLLKTVVGFMEQGAPTDTQHNREGDGRVVLSWVFDQETNDALEVKSRKFGWATGLKVSPATFAKFKSGELTGFSIDGEGIRDPIAKSHTKIIKASLYTTEIDGHQHSIDVCDDGSLWCSYATSAGADNSHNHAVTRGDNGAIVILADSGHSHDIAEGQPAVVLVAADAIVVVQASAPRSTAKGSLTTPIALSSVSSTNPNEGHPTMKTDADKLADLQKRHDRLLKMAGVHKMHFDTLTGDDADAFLAKSFIERQAVIETAEKSNPVVFTAKSGKVFRESDKATGLVDMAMQLDAQADELTKARDTAENAEYAQHAGTKLASLGGEIAVRTYVVKSIRKGGGTDETVKAALAILDAADVALKLLGTAHGVGGEGVPVPVGGNPTDVWKAAVVTFAKAKDMKDLGKAEDLFLDTPEGLAAKRVYDQTSAAARRAAGL